jgi:UDP-N-acetylmuramoyl-L-alanyl-D-glutamate--2,6-diaminopimelate ligase
MRLKELIEAIGKEAAVDADVTSVECDSRKVAKGSVFVATKGEHFDGADFIEEAAQNGAVCVITERMIDEVDCPQILVEDARVALAILSSKIFGEPSKQMRMAAVTGTNGKTTVAYLLESVFKAAGFKSALMGTVENRYDGIVQDSTLTTPMADELQGFLRTAADAGVTRCVMEVSSHALSQHRVDGCSFDVKVFTNLTPEHLDYHGTMEDYFKEKSRLFAPDVFGDGGGAVINIDDEWGRILKEKTIPALGYSLKVEGGGDIYPMCYAVNQGGIRASLQIPGSVLVINSELVGEYNLYNIMAAAGAAYVMGIEGSLIEKGINALKSIPGRLERVGRDELGFDAYVDYAHTSDALERTLKVLRALKKGGRLITVFGCGGDRDTSKRPVMGKVAAGLSDVAIVTSDNPRDEDPMKIIEDIEAGLEGVNKFGEDAEIVGKGYLVIPERAEAISKAVEIARSGDIVLIAGKGHEDYQIIKGERIFFDDRVVLGECLQTVLDEGIGSA